MSLGRVTFQLAYEYSPIILVNGIAQNIPGQMLPIIAITQAANFAQSILNGANPIDPNTLFAHFRPVVGGNLIKNDIGKYPFANQSVAANAVITEPINISLSMETPANQAGSYVSKLVSFSALKAALDLHTSQGGWYTVLTPSFIYTNAILLNLRDVSDGGGKQVQTRWQWDFECPLITLTQAASAQSTQMSKLTQGLPTTSTSWSGAQF